MFRAVPSMALIAASIDPAFMSLILILAISSRCFRVTVPTFSLLGVPLPFSMPMAMRISTDAGALFRMNLKLRSL